MVAEKMPPGANSNRTQGSAAILLIRLMVGAVFLSEGLQKFIFAAELGAGRFAKIGLPAPGALGPLVGACEIAGGLLVLCGAWTRIAVLPLLAVISTAIVTTKLPMLVHDGFWKMAHEARTDYAMFLGLLFLLISGGGRWSWDARRASNQSGT